MSLTPNAHNGRSRWFCRVTALLVVGVLSSCAFGPSPRADVSPRPDDFDSFARQIREDLQDHAWQSLLVAVDPTLYQEQVVAERVDEVLFLSRLLGLTSPGNQIQVGDELDWEDLARIGIATLAPTGDGSDPAHYTGLVTLATGEQLRLNVWMSTVRGRFVIIAPPAA